VINFFAAIEENMNAEANKKSADISRKNSEISSTKSQEIKNVASTNNNLRKSRPLTAKKNNTKAV
jgi:predicted phosphoribosyltransferase